MSDVACYHVQGRPPHGHACSVGPVPKNQNQSKFTEFHDVPITNISSTPCAISLVFRGEHESCMYSGQDETKTRAIGHTLVMNDLNLRLLTQSSSFDRLLHGAVFFFEKI
jgi:hypothetical protein